jgi:hypothetical protein
LDLRSADCGCVPSQYVVISFRWNLRFRHCPSCRSNLWLLGGTPVGRPDQLLRQVWAESAVEAVRNRRRGYRRWDSIQLSSSGPLSKLTIRA